jgi:hypothetical protein
VFVGILQSFGYAPQSLRHVLGFSSSINSTEVINKTNQQRANSGLEPLAVNASLNAAALAKGQNMMNDQYWAHISPGGVEPWYFIQESGYDYSIAGENLARDFAETDSMMSAWMASPTHRANILNSRYSEIGIAVINGNLLGYDTTLVVQMFGKPRSEFIAGSIPTENENEFALNPGAEQVSIVSAENQTGVLAGVTVPAGQLETPALFTPLQLSKAFFLALIMVIIATLLYDSFVIGNRQTARMVGKNFAHLIYLSAIAYLVIFFKAGLVG